MPEYPVNAWYAACWEEELVGQKPLGRDICDLPMVFYRTETGAIACLENACLHRLLPLSLGYVKGSELICGYHGMGFAEDGRCTRMPVPSEKPSPNAAVRSYPTVLKHKIVWVWPGDSARVDQSLVPEFHWADDGEWAGRGNTLELECDYRLLVDNLMDLTHETFVHATSIGHGQILEAPFQVEHENQHVSLTRWMIDCEAPPFLAMQLRRARGLPPEHVDRWQIIHFQAPATIVIDVGVAPTGSGAPEGDRSKGIAGCVLNTITPASDNRCHYFFAFMRAFDHDDAELTESMREGVTNIFLEDKVVLEQQQEAILRYPKRRLLNIGIDQGSFRARKAIDRMIALEEAN